ncbi:MAG: SDR family oxidoreductase [Clostridia bacterium]|nr:SDR family oxidoreductase [Clostridia bacterium]
MKTVVITGAGGVLCSCFAKALAADGCGVALLDINGEAVEELASEIGRSGGVARAYKANVLDREMLEGVRELVHKDLGRCDVLINGAGGNNPRATTVHEVYEPGDETRDDVKTFFNLGKNDFNFVFDLNIVGVMIPTQVFAQDMIPGGGSIVNISSMNAIRPLTKIPAYSSAKAGVSNLTKWLAVHFAGTGIRANAILPGFFVTNQNRALLYAEDGTPTPRTDKILAATPMKRFGEPEELLGALRFLIDDKASGFITGVELPVDGGFAAYSGV